VLAGYAASPNKKGAPSSAHCHTMENGNGLSNGGEGVVGEKGERVYVSKKTGRKVANPSSTIGGARKDQVGLFSSLACLFLVATVDGKEREGTVKGEKDERRAIPKKPPLSPCIRVRGKNL